MINQKTKNKLSLIFSLCFFCFIFWFLNHQASAVSPTLSPTATPSAEPTQTASSSASTDEKVKEIRDALKEKAREELDKIKEKIEKKAYVGTIEEITDLTITLKNFRGKQRVQLSEETTILNASKKEIKAADLAVDDKVIAMGTVTDNEVLQASRVVVVPSPKTASAKKMVLFGAITEIDSKASTITVSLNGQETLLKIAAETNFISPKNPQTSVKFKDLTIGQKVIVIYRETASGKTPTAVSLYLLP